jgi:hypothetical protein
MLHAEVPILRLARTDGVMTGVAKIAGAMSASSMMTANAVTTVTVSAVTIVIARSVETTVNVVTIATAVMVVDIRVAVMEAAIKAAEMMIVLVAVMMVTAEMMVGVDVSVNLLPMLTLHARYVLSMVIPPEIAGGVDTNWYYDTGVTDHITGELNKLSTHDTYHGQGIGMHISHIGHSIVRTPHHSFDLNAILHVPSASKNLLSVHRFTLDNHVFIEFHPFFFLIKDQSTRRILFKGPCHGGLYPLMPISDKSSKHAFITIKPMSSMWHCHLGHPSSFVVQ